MSKLLDLFHERSETQPDKVFLRQPKEGRWKEYTYFDAYNISRQMSSALQGLFEDSKNVGILSKNCAHWILSDFSIFMSGGVSVPILTDYSNETLEKILKHAEIKILFCGKLENWDRLKKVIPKDVLCISFPDMPLEGCIPWDELIKKQEDAKFDPVKRSSSELATLIYTSGSTGNPKGVMHTFECFDFVAKEVSDLFGFKPTDKVVSYLPLAHCAERALYELGAFWGKAQINFVDTLSSFGPILEEVQPQSFLGVPRIWEKLQEGVLKKFDEKKLKTLLKIPLISSFIKRKIRYKLGLSKVRYTIAGSAPLPPSVFNWFKELGILVRDGYGMTETMAYAHFAMQKKVKPGTVGKALVGVQSRIADNGELQIKSPSNTVGFYKEDKLTKEAFTEDGFLKTGDRGNLDKEGYLTITGRLKDLFKTSKGKYIAPSKIEAKIISCSIIDQCCVLGSGMTAPCALVNMNELSKEMSEKEATELLKSHITEINQKLEHHEKLSKIFVLKKNWTAENGFLTPTLKVKRAEVESFYIELVTENLKQPGNVCFLNA